MTIEYRKKDIKEFSVIKAVEESCFINAISHMCKWY